MTTTIDHSQAERFDYLVFIGRFQPFHLGHQAVIEAALKCSDRVIVLVGSSHQPRSIRNPWKYEEREQFIKRAFAKEDAERVITAPLVDLYNDNKWVALVESKVKGIVDEAFNDSPAKIGLIGHSKDHSSYYLSLFPEWQGVNVDSYETLSATPLRDYYFREGKIPEGLTANVAMELEQQLHSKHYQYLKEESAYIKAYKKAWELAPYPPLFATVDAVVVQAGHVLLIERKGHPGKGLLALPGGFLEVHERLVNGMLRELREETQINIEEEVLLKSVVKKEVFDSPYRSVRGRTISHAYLLELEGDKQALANVVASDDAQRVIWMPVDNIDAEVMFEDHAHIIKTMLQKSDL